MRAALESTALLMPRYQQMNFFQMTTPVEVASGH